MFTIFVFGIIWIFYDRIEFSSLLPLISNFLQSVTKLSVRVSQKSVIYPLKIDQVHTYVFIYGMLFLNVVILLMVS